VLGTVNEAIRFPADLPCAIQDAASRLAEQTARALGFGFGSFHGEYIVGDGDALYFTEMSNRGGGVHISNIAVPFVSGVDVVRRYVDDALGIPSEVQVRPQGAGRAALLHFFADDRLAGGRLRAVRGQEKAAALAGVLACRLFVQPGGTFGKGENGARRQGMIIAGGDAGADLDGIAAVAQQVLDIDIETESVT